MKKNISISTLIVLWLVASKTPQEIAEHFWMETNITSKDIKARKWDNPILRKEMKRIKYYLQLLEGC